MQDSFGPIESLDD